MAVTLTVVALGYQGSVAYIPVSLAGLLFYSYPLLVGAIAIVAGRDRMTPTKAVALIAAFAGLALALSPGANGLDWRGIALVLSAALSMAIAVSFGGRAAEGEDGLLMGVYTNIWMLIALLIVASVFGQTSLPSTPLGTFGVVGVCITYVLAYACWYLALTLVRPVRLAALFNIEPLVTLTVAWLALGETMTGIQLVGAALVLGSVLSMSLSYRTEAKQD
jgi:drug/metabolite transporter (DMT)-like permease